jgi:hypothetical protein
MWHPCTAIFIHQRLGRTGRQHGIAKYSTAASSEIRPLHRSCRRRLGLGSLRWHQPRHLMPTIHDGDRFTTLHQRQPRWQALAELLESLVIDGC